MGARALEAMSEDVVSSLQALSDVSHGFGLSCGNAPVVTISFHYCNLDGRIRSEDEGLSYSLVCETAFMLKAFSNPCLGTFCLCLRLWLPTIRRVPWRSTCRRGRARRPLMPRTLPYEAP